MGGLTVRCGSAEYDPPRSPSLASELAPTQDTPVQRHVAQASFRLDTGGACAGGKALRNLLSINGPHTQVRALLTQSLRLRKRGSWLVGVDRTDCREVLSARMVLYDQGLEATTPIAVS